VVVYKSGVPNVSTIGEAHGGDMAGGRTASGVLTGHFDREIDWFGLITKNQGETDKILKRRRDL
jgi:hypothetical protein